MRTIYIVMHIFFKFILFLIFWTLAGRLVHKNPKKAYHQKIPDLKIVTVHRRSDSKRAYGYQAFFFKLNLTAMIKQIKNNMSLSSLGRYVFGSEISYNKAPPRLPGLGC
jgi:hypothetical protein